MDHDRNGYYLTQEADVTGTCGPRVIETGGAAPLILPRTDRESRKHRLAGTPAQSCSKELASRARSCLLTGRACL